MLVFQALKVVLNLHIYIGAHHLRISNEGEGR